MPSTPAASLSFRRELRETAVLALPLIAGQLAAIGQNVVDTMLAGHLDAHTLAAVAVGAGIWSLALVTVVGTMMAVQPSVAQLAGARRYGEIGPLFRQSLWLALLLGGVLWLLLRAAGPHLLPLFAIDAGLAGDCTKFLRAIAWGTPALALYFAMRGLSEGLELTRPTMYFGLFGLLLLAPVGYVLMYGRLGFAPRGAQGSGLATALVLWIQALAFALYLRRHRNYSAIAPFARFEWPRWRDIGALLRLGLPIAVSFLMETSLFVCAGLLLASIGANTVAGHQIALNAASVTFMVPVGLGVATMVRVGNAAGRGDARGARAAGLAGIGLSLLTQFVSASLMALFSHAIARAYSDDAQVAALGAQLLLLAAVFQFSDGIQVTAGNALRGLKDTVSPMLITALAYWGVGMPVGAWLTFRAGYGARGMWLGLAAGLTVAALLLSVRFLRRTSLKPVRKP